MTQDKLDKLWARGLEFLGCKNAILGGAMSWVSEHNLVAAISNAGAFGVIACGAMPPDLLEKEIIKTKQLTNKNFGVNLIVVHEKIEELIDICGKHKITHIVLAGGIPKATMVDKIKSYGAKSICFAPSAAIGKKLVRFGVDALIIEGSEAGGHIGQVSTSVLAQEILPEIKEVPIFVAGGIGRGEAIAIYLQMGASGVQIGTKFVCATQSIAHDNFKKIFINSNARDAVASQQVDADFPVVPVRAIANKATNEFTKFQKDTIAKYRAGEIDKKTAQLTIEHFWAGALKKAVIDGDVENGSLMAGQSVGMVAKIEPAQDIILELTNQARKHLQNDR
jgi:enoyl-[acyl-carrier protein] reductase II